MQIDRKQLVEELQLRKQIRKAIKIVQERKKKESQAFLKEEQTLRKIIQQLIKETTVGGSEPERSTGINELERVLKEVIKILEQDYKRLTTSEEQRRSFRTHVIKGVQNLLAPERAVDISEPSSSFEPETIEEVEIDIEDEEDDAFIDVRGEKDPENKSKEPPEDEFGIEGEDKTGRNYAYQSFKKIENQIMKGYEILDDEQDKSLFYDYLITNLKLYFDKFEDELQADISPEPTTPEYEQEKSDQLGEPTGGELSPPEEDAFDLGQ